MLTFITNHVIDVVFYIRTKNLFSSDGSVLTFISTHMCIVDTEEESIQAQVFFYIYIISKFHGIYTTLLILVSFGSLQMFFLFNISF